MTGVFPGSGVGSSDAQNSIDPINMPAMVAGCEALWYSTMRCQPRFDPAAANALLSEMMNLIKCAGTTYDCTHLNNLCVAIQKMLDDNPYRCLPQTFPYVAGNACSIEQLVQFVDNTGCIKIGKLPAGGAVIVSDIDTCNSVGVGFDVFRPSPTDVTSYYDMATLTADRVANTVNNTKLGRGECVRGSFTVPCACYVNIHLYGDIHFDPTANSGAGAQSRMVYTIDGVLALSSNNVIDNYGDFSNFETTFDRIHMIGVSAGTHTFAAQMIKNGAVAAQGRVACTAGPSVPSPSWAAKVYYAI